MAKDVTKAMTREKIGEMTKKPMSVGEKCRVKIERLSIGGRGVARHEGLVIFVGDVIPEEIVEIELTLVKKNFAEARLLEIVEPSPSRMKPVCPVFGTCGGCNWQHIDYEMQLRQKRALVLEAFRKFSKFEDLSDAIREVVPSPNQFRYRNRIQLHHRSDKQQVTVGFHQRASHRIVDIQDCPITEEVLTQNLPQLHEKFRDQPPGRFEIYLTEAGEVRNRTSFSDTQIDDSFKERSNKAEQPPFAQVNTAQNKNLVEYCLSVFEKSETNTTNHVYDLYSGHGNFTFPLAALFPNAKVEAVELNPQSVLHGNKTAQERRIGHQIRFTASDVGLYLEQKRPPKNSLMLLDPPRMGCEPAVMTAIARAKPELIVYVSCHPVTLARDLGVLNEASQNLYELIEVTPFDMFPQTDHVETVAVLRRKSELEKL